MFQTKNINNIRKTSAKTDKTITIVKFGAPEKSNSLSNSNSKILVNANVKYTGTNNFQY